MNSFNIKTIDIGSAPNIQRSFETHTAFFEKHGIATPESFSDTIQKSFGKAPWPRKTNMGTEKPTRLVEIIEDAFFVDRIQGRFGGGFRVQIDSEDDLAALYPPTRTVLLGWSKVANYETELEIPKCFQRFVFLNQSMLSKLHFVFYVCLASESDKAAEEIKKISKQVFSVNIEPTVVLNHVSDAKGEWYYVGCYRCSDQTPVVIHDPISFGVFVLTRDRLYDNLGFLVSEEDQRKILENMPTSGCGLELSFSIPGVLNLSTDKTEVMDESIVKHRQMIAGDKTLHFHTFEETLKYNTDYRKEVAKMNALALAPLRACRTLNSIDVEELDYTSFISFHERCGRTFLVLKDTELRRISECLLALSKHKGASLKDMNIVKDEVVFRDIELLKNV